jgi:hypothetical protein
VFDKRAPRYKGIARLKNSMLCRMGFRDRQRVTTGKDVGIFPAREVLPASEETPRLPFLDAREAGYIRNLCRDADERKRKLWDACCLHVSAKFIAQAALHPS